jgi:hypothetical protein
LRQVRALRRLVSAAFILTGRKVGDLIIRIKTSARHLALQVARLIPILAGGLGLLNSFRMMRLPGLAPSEAAEDMVLC